MRKRSSGTIIFQILLGILLCLMVISLAVTIVLHCRSIYYADIRLLHIAETSGYAEDVIRRNYDVLIDYNTIGFTGPLSFPDFVMSETGRIHFEEVKVIFDAFSWMAILLVPVCAAGLFLCKRLKSWLCLLIGGILGLCIPALLAAAVAVSWDTVFVTFHQIVFHNDFWIFDWTTDPIILILPDTFFMHCAILIFLLVFLSSIFMIIFYKMSKKRMLHN